MKALRNYINRIKPNFEPGGKFSMFQSVFEGFETFLFVPNTTSKSGVHIHDSIDTKRTMTVVIIALLPALLFGMYNVGYQHYLAIGELAQTGFWMTFLFGFLAVLPKIIVSYVVGLGIEFAVAQMRGHEIQEGFLVSGILIPMIVPIDTPLWMIAVATAFAVIFAKEVFGGTGMVSNRRERNLSPSIFRYTYRFGGKGRSSGSPFSTVPRQLPRLLKKIYPQS